MKKFNLSIISTLVLSSLSHTALAETDYFSSISTTVVTATKTNKNILDVPQAIAVSQSEDIKEQQATDLSESLDRLPGVKATGGPYGGITIRGGSRGQVILNVDGVNQTIDSNKGMSINPLTIDPLLVKQVEVVKSGGSALYGSGGIGGVVVIKTKNVDELLKDGKDFGGFARTRLDSSDDAFHTGVGVYGRTSGKRFDFLVTADGYNSELNKEDSAKYSKNKNRNLVGKFGMNVDNDQRVQLNLKHSENKHTNDRVAPDDFKNDTAQITHELYSGDHVNLKSSLSFSRMNRSAAMTNMRAGLQDSKIERIQFDIQNTHDLIFGPTSHEVTYGAGSLQSKQSGTVNGKKDNFANANGKRKEYGVFIQDTIDWEMLTVTGALRYVNYNMTGSGSSDVKTKKLLPSFGTTVHATDWLNLYASYSHDFRAPSIDEMYTEIHYPSMGGRPAIDVLPNPNLKPENSVNSEFGFGLHKSGLFTGVDSGTLRVTYFNQNIDDMIAISRSPVVNPNNGHLEFSTINIAEANRTGVELSLGYDIDNLSFMLSTDYLKIKDKKLNTTDSHARNLNAALTYNITDQNVDFTWLTTSASSSKVSGSHTSGYSLHGIRASVEFKDVELSAGVRNLFDKEYVTEKGYNGQERTYMIGAAYSF